MSSEEGGGVRITVLVFFRIFIFLKMIIVNKQKTLWTCQCNFTITISFSLQERCDPSFQQISHMRLCVRIDRNWQSGSGKDENVKKFMMLLKTTTIRSQKEAHLSLGLRWANLDNQKQLKTLSDFTTKDECWMFHVQGFNAKSPFCEKYQYDFKKKCLLLINVDFKVD